MLLLLHFEMQISENEAVRSWLKCDATVSALKQVSNVATAAHYVGAAAFALRALAVRTYENMQYNMTNLLDLLVRWHRIGFRLGNKFEGLGQELREFAKA
jgi:hypothetical protein